MALSPQAALACGGMVSESGGAELTGFEALLRWEDGTEELLVSVGFASPDPTFGWLMPLPSAPEIEEADLALIEEAFEITEPPRTQDDSDGEGAGAPMVGGAPGVDVIGRDTVGGLRFVTLGGERAGEVARWMRKHHFGFHDRQEPVLQDYLDRRWVVVAARVAPGETLTASLSPISFTFPSPEPTYPLAMAGSGHLGLDLGMSLFVLTPFRPASTTYPERIVRPDPGDGFAPPGRQLELRYSAPLGDQAERMEATPDTWLTRYEMNARAEELTEDLVLTRATEQSAVDYANLLDGGGSQGSFAWVMPVAIGIVGVALAIRISVGMARRRRAGEAARMPGSGPGT